jgi:hypothetical protein
MKMCADSGLKYTHTYLVCFIPLTYFTVSGIDHRYVTVPPRTHFFRLFCEFVKKSFAMRAIEGVEAFEFAANACRTHGTGSDGVLWGDALISSVGLGLVLGGLLLPLVWLLHPNSWQWNWFLRQQQPKTDELWRLCHLLTARS